MNAVRKPAFDVEAALLAAMMADEQAYWRVADIVVPEDFASADHRALWTAVAEAAQRREPVDAITIGEKYPWLGQLALSVVTGVGVASNARAYAELIVKRCTERRVKAAGQRIAQLVGDDTLGEAQRILAACVRQQGPGARSIGEFARESVRAAVEKHGQPEAITGVPSGFAELDDLTAGWQRGNLIVLGARPSVGKTGLALQFAIHAAIHGFPGLFISLEMTGTQLTDRALAQVGNINALHIRAPKRMTDDEWPRLSAAQRMLDDVPLLIDEGSARTIEAICARIRQCNATQRLGLVVIDYLTQMTPPRADRADLAWQIVTRLLKQTALELKVPIMLLSQFNREGADRPTLTSFREAGSIEQDADECIGLWRPDPEKRNIVALEVLKQRNGPVGTIYLDANVQQQRFEVTEWAPPVVPPKKGGNGRGYGGNPGADKAAPE